jgi:hypothetical protein
MAIWGIRMTGCLENKSVSEKYKNDTELKAPDS